MADEAARKEEIYTPQSFSVDDLEIEELDKKDDLSEPRKEPVQDEDDVEIEIEGKEKSVEVEEKETDVLRREISGLKDEIIKLSSRRSEPIPDLKPKDDKPEKLTRGQIAKILTEHKDDPEVLLNVIDYISEQKAIEIKDSTVKDINHRQWASNLSGVVNKIFAEDEDGYLAANPKVVSNLDDMAGNLGLGDHPIGKLAAYAIYRLTEATKAKQKKDVESDRSEKITKTRVMDKTRTSDKSNKSFGLSAMQLETAKKFGVKPETYAKFVRRS